MFEAHCTKCSYDVEGPAEKSIKDTIAAHRKLAHPTKRKPRKKAKTA